jgi:hypothetical protein
MASYVFSFTGASNDISNTTAGQIWQEIPLDASQGNYAQANTGHQAIDISVTATASGTAHTLTLAWVDCDSNKANIGLGVTKYDTITATPSAGNRRSGLNGSSGDYVCTISAASSSSSLVKVNGIGDVIDLRTSPVALPKRRLFIGLTTLGGGGGTVTVIVTPTKIV